MRRPGLACNQRSECVLGLGRPRASMIYRAMENSDVQKPRQKPRILEMLAMELAELKRCRLIMVEVVAELGCRSWG